MILKEIWIHLYSKTWTNMQIHLYELMDENKSLKIFIRFEEEKNNIWINLNDEAYTNKYPNIFVFLKFFGFIIFLFWLCRTVAGWEQAGVGGSIVHFLYFCKCNIVFLAKATFLFLLKCGKFSKFFSLSKHQVILSPSYLFAA